MEEHTPNNLEQLLQDMPTHKMSAGSAMKLTVRVWWKTVTKSLLTPQVSLARVGVSFAVVAVAVSGFGSYAYASPRVTEGNVLYPVKQAIEQVEIAIAEDEAAKAAVYREHANRRLEEAEWLQEQEDAAALQATLEAAEELNSYAEQLEPALDVSEPVEPLTGDDIEDLFDEELPEGSEHIAEEFDDVWEEIDTVITDEQWDTLSDAEIDEILIEEGIEPIGIEEDPLYDLTPEEIDSLTDEEWEDIDAWYDEYELTEEYPYYDEIMEEQERVQDNAVLIEEYYDDQADRAENDEEFLEYDEWLDEYEDDFEADDFEEEWEDEDEYEVDAFEADWDEWYDEEDDWYDDYDEDWDEDWDE